jgi:integrase
VYEEEEGLRVIKRPQKTSKKMRDYNHPLWLLSGGRPERILRKYMEGKGPNDLIFGHIENGDFNDYLREMFAIAGVFHKHIKVHSLRHSFGMNLLGDGMELQAVSRLMAHSSLETTLIYARMISSFVDNRSRETYGNDNRIPPGNDTRASGPRNPDGDILSPGEAGS